MVNVYREPDLRRVRLRILIDRKTYEKQWRCKDDPYPAIEEAIAERERIINEHTHKHMSSLYKLALREQQILEQLYRVGDETGGEITPELEALMDAQLEAEGKITDKFNSYGHILSSVRTLKERRMNQAAALELEAKPYLEEAERKKADADRLAKLEHSLVNRAKNYMQRTGKALVECPDFSFQLKGKKGKRSVDVLVEPERLPAKYQKAEITLRFNGDAITDDELKALAVLQSSDHVSFTVKTTPDKVALAKDMVPPTSHLPVVWYEGYGEYLHVEHDGVEIARMAPKGAELEIF